MAAKDYKICPALFSAYIAKISKRNPNQMTEDRREITENEILMLIDWYMNNKCGKEGYGIVFDSVVREGMQIHMKFCKKEDPKEEPNTEK